MRRAAGPAGSGAARLLLVDQPEHHRPVSSGGGSRGPAQVLVFLAWVVVLAAQAGRFGLVVAGGALCLAGADLGPFDPGAEDSTSAARPSGLPPERAGALI